MARIRTVKPEFFRHELLQDLELANPGKYPMMVFEGLWGHCDKNGSFEWKPRTLKLDILPFLPFDMEDTLKLLENAKMIMKYTIDGVDYGFIPTFKDHQRIGGTEAQDPSKFPQYINNLKYKNKKIKKESPEKQQGSNEEALGQHLGLQEGKGREEEGKRKGRESVAEKQKPDTPPTPTPEKILELYHELCPSLRKVEDFTPKRRKQVEARLKKHPELEFWENFFKRVEASDFLGGRSPPSKGYTRPFLADFEYVTNLTNFTEIIEGKYDNHGADSTNFTRPVSRAEIRERNNFEAIVAGLQRVADRETRRDEVPQSFESMLS